MDESVRSASDRVTTWVGFSVVGGGLFVYFGSHRIALAVVSFSAIASGEEGGLGAAEERRGGWEGEPAVLAD